MHISVLGQKRKLVRRVGEINLHRGYFSEIQPKLQPREVPAIVTFNIYYPQEYCTIFKLIQPDVHVTHHWHTQKKLFLDRKSVV